MTTDLEDLFAILPRVESELSYSTPRSTLEPISSDTNELAVPVPFQPMMGEGEPAWDEDPENEGGIFDISLTFYRAPSWLDSNDVDRSSTPVGWKAYSPPISQVSSENVDPIPVPEPSSLALSVGTQNCAC